MIQEDVGQLTWDAPIHVGVVFETLKKDIQDHRTEYADLSPALDRLMADFDVFATDYYSYFLNLPAEQYDAETTHVQLLSRILDKLNSEWTAIRLAAEQRSKNLYARDLASADRRAARYLAAFDGDRTATGDEATPDVVTHFHKVPNIARFPYSPVPLIGLNLVASANDPASMAIAHEVGHHVYWRAPDPHRFGAMHNVLSDALYSGLLSHYRSKFSGDPANLESYAARMKTWLGWSEEVFADVYGCLVAGPPYVWAAQKLFLREVGDRRALADDDGEHPCPYLRPLVQIQALRVMAKRHWNEGQRKVSGKLKEIADMLDARWQQQCSELPQGVDQDNGDRVGVVDVVHDPTELPLGALVEDIPQVIESILETPFFKTEGQSDISLLYAVDLYGCVPLDVEAMSGFRAILSAEEAGPETKASSQLPGLRYSDSFTKLLEQTRSMAGNAESLEWQLLSNMQLSTTSLHPARIKHEFTAHNTWHSERWCKKHRH